VNSNVRLPIATGAAKQATPGDFESQTGRVGIAHKICWWAVSTTIDFQTTHTKRSSDQRFNRLCEHAITHHLNTNEAIYTIAVDGGNLRFFDGFLANGGFWFVRRFSENSPPQLNFVRVGMLNRFAGGIDDFRRD
jgi:hypothetical protein